MADLTITPANVVAQPGAKNVLRTAGATITAGKAVYRDAADFKSKLADCDDTEASVRAVEGLALNGASNGQPLVVHTEGPITIGAVLTPGTAYYLSGTAGGICPLADLGAGDYVTLIGIALSASVLDVNIQASGVQL